MTNDFKARYKHYQHSPILKLDGSDVMTIDKIAEITPVSDSPENNTFNFTISTNNLDRCNDIMIPTGGQFEAWLRNPVVLSRHNSYDFPYGKGLSIEVVGNGVVSQAMFHDFNDEAILIRKLLNGGYLRAVSIGFIPRTWTDRTPKTDEVLYPTWEEQGRVREHTGWELLEYSVVTIPANGWAIEQEKQILTGIEKAITDGVIESDNRIAIDIKSKINIPKIIIPKIIKEIKMQTLTPEQIAQVNTALEQPVADAIVTVLTGDPFLLSPEDAAMYAQEGVGAMTDALIAISTGADTDIMEEEPATTDATKQYKSKFARTLVNKAGAKIGAATKAELNKAMEHMDTAMASAKATKSIVKALVDAATTTDDGEKSITDKLKIRALEAEIQLLKTLKEQKPQIATQADVENMLKNIN